MKHIPNMKEKTLRYPGHIAIIQALKSSGFFSEEKISVGSADVSPMEVTSKILIDDWKLNPNEPEFTVMRVIIKGIENGKKKTIIYNLYDEYDPKTQQWSMARTTGYTATAAVNLIANNLYSKSGVAPLEMVGSDKNCFQFVLDYLKDRNINYNKEEIYDKD